MTGKVKLGPFFREPRVSPTRPPIRIRISSSAASLFTQYAGGRRSSSQDVGRDASDTYVTSRLCFNMWRYLGVGSRWIIRFLSLGVMLSFFFLVLFKIQFSQLLIMELHIIPFPLMPVLTCSKLVAKLGVQAQCILYEGKTHTDLFVQDPMRGGRDDMFEDLVAIIQSGDIEAEARDATAPPRNRLVPNAC